MRGEVLAETRPSRLYPGKELTTVFVKMDHGLEYIGEAYEKEKVDDLMKIAEKIGKGSK